MGVPGQVINVESFAHQATFAVKRRFRIHPCFFLSLVFLVRLGPADSGKVGPE